MEQETSSGQHKVRQNRKSLSWTPIASGRKRQNTNLGRRRVDAFFGGFSSRKALGQRRWQPRTQNGLRMICSLLGSGLGLGSLRSKPAEILALPF